MPTVTANEISDVAQMVAKTYMRQHTYRLAEVPDIMSDAALGVVMSVPRWNPKLAAFRTYASRRGFGQIADGLRQRGYASQVEFRRVREDPTYDIPEQRMCPLSLDDMVLPPAIPDDQAGQPDLGETDIAEKVLRCLPVRERDVIVRCVMRQEPMRQVGVDWHVSESRICQLRRAGLDRIRRKFPDDMLRMLARDAAE